MIEQANCFNRVSGHNGWVGKHQEIITIGRFATRCQIRGAGEDTGSCLRAVVVKIDYDKFVMDNLSSAAAILCLEWPRNLALEEMNDTGSKLGGI